MAKGEIFTARVESIAAGGAGIARLNETCRRGSAEPGSPPGKSVFIELTAPGDLARFRIEKDQKNWARAELLEILEPSPVRVSPTCSLYGRCGGCSLQHLTYEAQLQAKTTILSDAFKRIGGFDPPVIRVRPCVPFEYRCRVQFHKTGDCDAHVGFMERKSSRVVTLSDCPVAEPGIREALREKKIQWPNKKRFTVYSNGKTFLVEGGLERGNVSILNRELVMDVNVFFQSNAAMLEFLVTDLIEAAGAADKSLPLADIYAGVGTFAAFLGESFPAVDLVEENKAALALAKKNVTGKQVNFYAGKDTAWVKTLQANEKNAWGFMVMDPPREGLSASFAKWLAESGPDLAAYVSCDPATLARDSRLLLEGGYALKELTFYDFYPQTAHIESLALFSRNKHYAR